jgi:phosphinothricin acetyltransferase
MTATDAALRIRAVRDDDLPAIASIYAHYVEHTYITFELAAPSLKDWTEKRAAARAAGHPWLVADIGERGGVVGYATCSTFNPKPAYRSTVETTIYLAEPAVGQGIGRPLYEALLAEAAGPFHVALAAIALPNPRSVALHERLGFTAVGVLEEVGHKLGAWRDVGWWQRRLVVAHASTFDQGVCCARASAMSCACVDRGRSRELLV